MAVYVCGALKLANCLDLVRDITRRSMHSHGRPTGEASHLGLAMHLCVSGMVEAQGWGT